MHQPDQTPHPHEQLSAGIDGELSREALRFLLRRLDHDDALRHRWANYHLTRDSLRRQLPPLAGGDFSARVMLAIEQETVVVAGARPHRWLRWSAGGAIAAGVAVAALMVTQPAGDTHRPVAVASTPAAKGMPVPATPALAPSGEVAVVPPWLSGKAPGLLSQRASATLGAPMDVSYARRLGASSGNTATPFRAQRYRTLDNHDGSYLILLDPSRQQVPDAPRQAAGTQ